MADTIPLESAIVKRIMRRLKAEPGVWLFNVHGSEYGESGIPDLVGCYYGRLFALEVKRPHLGRVSPKQEYTLRKIADAGGLAAVVDNVQDALDVLGIRASA